MIAMPTPSMHRTVTKPIERCPSVSTVRRSSSRPRLLDMLVAVLAAWVACGPMLVDALPPVIQIGAIFSDDQRAGPVELAFRYAVDRINGDKTLLPHTQLAYDVRYVSSTDSFRATKLVCAQAASGVQAIFGPSDHVISAHIQSICDALDIPHLQSRVTIEPPAAAGAAGPPTTRFPAHFSINIHPAVRLVNRAILELMAFLDWSRIAVLCEPAPHGLLWLRELVRTPGLDVYVRVAGRSSYETALADLKAMEFHHLLVDVRPHNMRHLLAAILRLQMNEYKFHYLFTTFDIDTLDLEDLKFNFVNITAFRLVDADDIGVREQLKAMERFAARERRRDGGGGDGDDDDVNTGAAHRAAGSMVRFIETEPALIYDAVHVFAVGLQTLDQSHALRTSNANCIDESPWSDGLSLVNYINTVEWKGLTGPIEFKEGRRTRFKLDLVKLRPHAIVKVGEWSPLGGLNVSDRAAFFDTGTMNVTLVVITILETPYVQMHYGKNFTGNERFFGFCVDILDRVAHEVGFDYILDLVPDRKYGAKDPVTGEWNGMVAQLMKHEYPYVMHRVRPNDSRPATDEPFEGFCIDLLRQIAHIVGFHYEISLAPDGKYGVLDPKTGEWNGMVRQLMDKKADLAVGSMTINYARESVIDFTKPFMNLGISILFKVPTTTPTRLFSFMTPLAVDIWLYVLAAYVLVSLAIHCVARFSPYEWHNPHPCDTDSATVENPFTVANSFWFAIGTLMQQGSDLNPKAISTRVVGGAWWFFTLIMISSYTANLAAFLTVERMITPIGDADDLAGQTEIAYGTLESGSTMTFFRDSMIETYKKMWRFMENRKPSAFTSTYEEGIRRVLDGNYAFLMESTMLDYIVQRDCNLTQIGGLLDTKGYGIATPMGSPWRDKISLAILELQEKGEIQMLYDKWWKNPGDTCVRSADRQTKESKANALGVDNIGGVFLVLLAGLGVAVTVAVAEFCVNHRRQMTAPTAAADDPFGGMDDAEFARNLVRLTGRRLAVASLVAAADDGTARQSLCAEMADELWFAVRCGGSRQRPALRRTCSRCVSVNRAYAREMHLAAAQCPVADAAMVNPITLTAEAALSSIAGPDDDDLDSGLMPESSRDLHSSSRQRQSPAASRRAAN